MNAKTLKTQVLIVGAGVAGSSLAIRLANLGVKVVMVEKYKFPRHKLCGEFVSPECLSHFKKLDLSDSIFSLGGDVIRETCFYSMAGKKLGVPSDWFFGGEVGALGISRAKMDQSLLEKARECGARVFEETRVGSLEIENKRITRVLLNRNDGDQMTIDVDLVVDGTGRARAVGKLVDRLEKSKTTGRKIQHIAFKAHMRGARIERGVCEIYFFRGGYGGINFVEDGAVNHCFIIDSKVAREFGGNADRIQKELIFQNKRAAEVLCNSEKVFDWLAVPVEKFGRQRSNNIENLIPIGDAGAFIDPFTGSGMLMALESSELLASVIAENKTVKGASQKNHFEKLLKEQTRRRLVICSLVRKFSFSPRLAGLFVALAGGGRSLMKMFATLTRPQRTN